MQYEVFRKDDGRYGWRLRDANGEIVPVKVGEIMLPPDPVAEERSRRAVQEVLRQQYEAQQATNA